MGHAPFPFSAPPKRTLLFPSEHAVPVARPSERPTLPTLPPVTQSILELSDSALESVRELPIDREDRAPALPATWWRSARSNQLALALLGAAVTLAVIGPSPGFDGPGREPRAAGAQHTPLAPRAIGIPTPPAGGCVVTGEARILASRAQLAAGLDVTAASSGFGVGFAASVDEGQGVRVDGSPLRVVDRLRLRSGSVRHVVVDDADADGVLHVDTDDARTLAAEGGTLRFAAVGGAIQASSWGLGGARSARVARPWPAPGAAAGRALPRPLAPLQIRAAAREDGGAVIALRRGATLWLGLVDGQLVAEGPLVALPRASSMVGTPSVTPWGSGGAAAWAERSAGQGFVVVVASFVSAADGEHEAPSVRVVGAGMSPSLAALPDGDLLLAYAVGGAGAHRVVAQRLARDLTARGEPLAVSPEAVNAGQPAAAASANGRALVAFFGADPGHAPSVLATPLACDPGL